MWPGRSREPRSSWLAVVTPTLPPYHKDGTPLVQSQGRTSHFSRRSRVVKGVSERGRGNVGSPEFQDSRLPATDRVLWGAGSGSSQTQWIVSPTLIVASTIGCPLGLML